MYKVGICGHFAFGKNFLNGQTVKTKIIADELCNQCGEAAVKKIDTHGGMKQVAKAVLSATKAMFNCRNLIILPARNGVRVFGPVLSVLKCFSKCRLHYVVIGGWLPQLVAQNGILGNSLKRFDFIYVETTTMQKAMNDLGFQNVVVMPNCKKLSILQEDEMVHQSTAPFALCTFSRVMKEKGIEDAAIAVRAVNERLNHQAFKLDVYGQVDAGQTDWFQDIQSHFSDVLCYKGAIPFAESVDTLKHYYALLFPTRFFTEGIPGTILDAYASGVPVIAAKWESYADVINDGETGICYPFGDIAALVDALEAAYFNPSHLNAMKRNCLRCAEDYQPCHVIKTLMQNMA